MKTLLRTLPVLMVLAFCANLYGQAGFSTSLHKTRIGKATWYAKENGGFEKLTNVPIDSMSCMACHAATYANGTPVDAASYTPDCQDCHDFTKGTVVEQKTCLGCHSRQATEINLSSHATLGPLFTDVHRSKGMECTACHSKNEMHGDGTAYESFLQPGATEVTCEKCHPLEELAGNRAHDLHKENVYCSACHVKTVVTCYNCHLETQIQADKKRFYGPPPMNGFVMLVNSEKLGKVTTASFQSLTFGDTTFYAVGAFHGHTVTKEARDCNECHNNAAVQSYNQSGEIIVTKWNQAQGKIVNSKGVIPVPADWQTSLKLDFAKFKGSPMDPLDSALDPGKWSYLKTGADGSQMLYATPLNPVQMAKLSLDMPSERAFQKSLHATRKGKNYWYGADTSVTKAPVPGFETLTGVPITHPNVACNDCHSGTGKDANGDAYATPYPGSSCEDCHATKTEGSPVSEDACLNCHSRQKTTWATLKYTDVHRNGDNPLKCWDCHSYAEMHGDGNEYNNMFESPVTTAACINCHKTENGTLPNHAASDPHQGKLSCEACHTKSVVSCYNCHFESQVDAHLKRAKQPIHDFVILVNRASDGKVAPASFQSLSYQGKTWMAMAPFEAHTTMENGRVCTDCHANFGGQIPAIKQYNDTHKIQFTTWNEADSTLSWLRGIVPLPADYERTFKMDFITYNGNSSDPVVSSKNWSKVGKDTWDGHQLFYATPMSKEQMQKIGFVTTAVGRNEGTDKLPTGFALKQNYPNPFNPTTTIEFTLPGALEVTLKVYSTLGEEVATLVENKKLQAGAHKLPFSAGKLSSGVYVFKLTADGFTDTKKMIVIK